jgi:hypothetical protein
MTVSLQVTGNGKFQPNRDGDFVSSYSLTEDATPLSVIDTAAAIPTMNIDGKSNNVETLGLTHPTSLLLLDNGITLTDSSRGSFSGKITDVSITGESVSITAQSIFESLNSEKTALPFNGFIGGAFAEYLELAGVTSAHYDIDESYDAETTANEAIYPGWTGKVWDYLKLLCIAVGAEISFNSDILYVKPRNGRSIKLDNVTNDSVSVMMPTESKAVSFEFLDTKYVTNAILKCYADSNDDGTEGIDVNETREITIESPISLASVNQPAYTNTVPESLIRYTEPTSIGSTPDSGDLNGFYCFVNSRANKVTSGVLESTGASVSVSIDPDNSYNAVVKIIGPNVALDTPWELVFSNTGDRKEQALMITGTGVHSRGRSYNKTDKVFDSTMYQLPTGLSVGDDVTDYSNNPFLSNKGALVRTASYSAKEAGGPKVQISLTTDIIEEAEGQEFSYVPGAIVEYGRSKYRVDNATYSYGSVDISATQHVTFADFNAKWAGKLYSDFNSTMFTEAAAPAEFMKYSDHAIIPLMEPI